jgi:hypothetical protein
MVLAQKWLKGDVMAKLAKNINGATGQPCKCENWLEHWEKFSGSNVLYCSQVDCSSFAEAGAHVLKSLSGEEVWYIIPLCREHNAMTGKTIEVTDTTIFVPARVEDRCGQED